MPLVVLLSAPYMLVKLERYEPLFARYGIQLLIPEVHERLETPELLKFAGLFDGAICGDDRFTAEVLAACRPRLKVISKWGTGIDSIDLAAAAKLGIPVRNTPDAFTDAVADSVLSYVLAFARQTPWLDRAVKAGHWSKLAGRSLAECTLAVIGVGRIGKAVLRRAQAFRPRLLGSDVIEMPAEFLAEVNVRMTARDEVLAQSDFISLRCGLNPTSRGTRGLAPRLAAEVRRVPRSVHAAQLVQEPAL